MRLKISLLLFGLLSCYTSAFSQTVKFGTTTNAHPQIPDLIKRIGPGPSGYGWSGIRLSIGQRYSPPGSPWSDHYADITDAKTSGYSWIIGQLDRDSIRFSRWSYVQSEVDSGKKWGVTCFYIDDCYSEDSLLVTKGQVDTVGWKVHKAGFRLAVAEYRADRVGSAASIGGYDSVDYIVPYQYGDTTAAMYQSLLQQIRFYVPNKPFIPQLGYHADHGRDQPPGFFPNQTGALGGGSGHIEVAKDYADSNIIFYYLAWDGPDSTIKLYYLDKITNYLQTNYNQNGYSMSGTPAPVGVILDQKLSNGTRVGTIGIWNGSSFPPVRSLPDTAFLQRTSSPALRGDVSIISEQKYHDWTRGVNQEPDVLNHHVFSSINVNDDNFTSHLNPTTTNNGITIQNNLIDAPSLTTYVGFADPWFIDYPDPSYGSVKRNRGISAPLISRQTSSTSPFRPDTITSYNGNKYFGVFTNQSGPPNWNPPYYSISFPSQSISVGGTNHPLYFTGWTASGATLQNSASDTTAVVFTGSNATVTANVKGSLLSNVSTASGYGTQSKIVRDYQGNLNLVYQSAGEIWYTKSTNNGQTWSPEVRISAGDDSARNPSIAQWYSSNPAYPNPYELYVVWVDAYAGQLGSGWSVFSNSLQISSNTWGTPTPVNNLPSGGVAYARSDSKPVASLVLNGGYQYTTVAFEGTGTGILIMTQNPYGTWYSSTLSTSTACEYPDLFTANYPSLGGFLMYVTYDDGNNLYMRYATNPAPSSGTPSFGSVYTVNSGVQCSSNTSGGITVDGAGTVRFS